MTGTVTKGSGTYCDRLLLELIDNRPNHLDVELAESVVCAAEYLSRFELVDVDAERAGVIAAINGMRKDDALSIVGKERPEYEGKFRVVFADGNINGSVTRVHALTELYETD